MFPSPYEILHAEEIQCAEALNLESPPLKDLGCPKGFLVGRARVGFSALLLMKGLSRNQCGPDIGEAFVRRVEFLVGFRRRVLHLLLDGGIVLVEVVLKQRNA
jgi:hypothetical protein